MTYVKTTLQHSIDIDAIITLHYFEYMKNFLSMLYKCYKELDKRFSTVNGKKLKKTERVEQTVLNSVLPVSKAEICDILPDVSPSTVEAVLGKMVKTGSVMKLGQARATKYVNAKYINCLLYTSPSPRDCS